MWQQLMLGAGGIAAVLATVSVLFILGMRMQFQPLLRTVRRMNRALLNPRALETAGRPGASASVVRHVGRTSGRDYATPVAAQPTDDGFVIVLPYGTSADWLRNVLAAGHATIMHEGVERPVTQPELAPVATVDRYFAPGTRRTHRLFGIDRVLVVRHAGAPRPPVR